jgi:hypothetical protein
MDIYADFNSAKPPGLRLMIIFTVLNAAKLGNRKETAWDMIFKKKSGRLDKKRIKVIIRAV